MTTVEKSIDVHVPVHTAYHQWTRFEEFPRFMDGVRQVRWLDDRHLHWYVEIGGIEEEWDAEITEQIPGQRIAWRSTSGARNDGLVTFHSLDANTTRIALRLDYEPHGFAENLGDMIGFVEARVEGDLRRFKEFVAAPTTTTPVPCAT